MRGFFRNAGLIALAEIVARLKGLLLLPLLTHHLGTVDYGAWSQVVVITALVPLFILLGTDSGVVRYLPGRPLLEQQRSFFGWLITLIGLTGVVCVALYFARTWVAVAFFGSAEGYAAFVPLAAASIFVTVLLSGIRGWLRLQLSAWGWAGLTVGQAVLSLLATVVVLIVDQGVYELVLYTVIADASLAFIAGALIVKRYGVAKPSFSLLPAFVRFGLPLVPAGFAMWGLNWLDRVFLVQYGTLSDIGIYSVAYTLGYFVIQAVANPLWTMYPTAVAEYWNRGLRPAVQRLFERSAGLTFVLVAPAITGSILLGRPLVDLLAPASFAGAGDVFALVMAGYLCLMLSSYYEVMFGLVHRQWLAAAAVVVAFAVNLGLNFALIPPYGYVGAAVATAAAFAAQLAFSMVIVSRMGILRTPFAGALRVLAATAGMVLLLLPVRELTGDAGAPAVLALIVCGAFTYLCLCLVFRVVSVSEVHRELLRLGNRLKRSGPQPAA